MSAAEEELIEAVEDHSEEEHVDERWLISYADMMTLLFGLFVMLYSMFDQFEIIQDATKKFREEKVEIEPLARKHDAVSPEDLKRAREEVEELKTKLFSLQVALEHAKAANAQAARAAEASAVHPDTERAEELEEQVRALKEQLTASQHSASVLREQIEAARVTASDGSGSGDANAEAAKVASSSGGGGGGGGGDGGEVPAETEVQLTLPGGRRVEMKAIHINTDGMMLTTPPPYVLPGDLFEAKITHKSGEVLKIMVRATGSGTDPGSWMKFDLVNHAEMQVLKRWSAGK